MVDSRYDALIQKQFKELQDKHKHLELHNNSNGYSISGDLGFSSKYQGVKIEDSFSIFIKIPRNYPNEIPIAKELGGRIPDDFHKIGKEILCLGTPTDQWIEFNKCKTLLSFVDKLIVPYFFSYCFKLKKGRMPFGERSHRGLGILEFYCGYFEIKDFEAARKLLKLLASGRYRKKKICPCGSGRRLQNCHGLKFLEIMKMQTVVKFKAEYQQALQLG